MSLLDQRKLLRTALRGQLIVCGESTGSARDLVPGICQTLIQALGCQIIQKVTRRAFGAALVAYLDKFIV